MRKIVFGFMAAVVSMTLTAEPLYETKKGGPVDLKSLAPSQQQKVFEVEFQRYEQLKMIADRSLLDQYFSEQAKKSKKTAEEVEAEAMTVKEPSDKETKKFFESNKDRIPPNYTFDQVKGEIKKIIQGQEQQKKTEELLAKIKKQEGFKILLAEPEAPQFKIETEGFAKKGVDNAKVQVVEFADYQCPHCKKAFESLSSIFPNFKSKVEFVFIDFPINRSGISRVVAEGSFCALEQGKYWEYHDLAFKGQESLKNESPLEFAKTLKLDEEKFKKCLPSAAAKTYVSKGKDVGEHLGVSGTPAIYIAGKRYMGGHETKDFTNAINEALKK